MGPKKAAGGAKKKEGNPEEGGELTAEDKAKMYMLACQSLQIQLGIDIARSYIRVITENHDIILAERTEESSKSLASKRELQARVEQISRDFEEEKKLTFEVTQDMTRQYKGMQEELLTRVS